MPEVIQQLDQQALAWIAEHLRCAPLDSVMRAYTRMGNAGILFILAAVVLLYLRPTRRAGAAALCAMLLGLLVVNMTVKPLVARARPWVVMEGFAALVAEGDPNSFPSGHTTSAFAFAGAVCAVPPWKRTKAAALLAAALMGFSRLYVGVHFPSDVLAGAAIGTLCGLLGARLVEWTAGQYDRRLKRPE